VLIPLFSKNPALSPSDAALAPEHQLHSSSAVMIARKPNSKDEMQTPTKNHFLIFKRKRSPSGDLFEIRFGV
jgi:hypothetical protein